ncbi:formate dehydrogenase [Hydrogenophaga sp. PBC]|uniref:formate dehydrogenase n=1 Tax=Hydrogenophaga sp. PBC TaxID=795665 RepID=UPI000854189C|nr:formate dehydrogenase [Hydrogenophaga sp. PBC]AOS80423.1 formate dehydrogenase [Hydrogenophaga sp. PBC]
MKESSRSGPAEGRSRLSRRTLFAGAGTVGAVAAVASVMPGASGAPEPAAAEPKPAPERGGGYTLSEHVQHYYRTTRI